MLDVQLKIQLFNDELKNYFHDQIFKRLQLNICQKLLFLHQLTNSKCDNRLFIELQVQYIKNSKLKPGENMLCTEIVSDIHKIFCKQHVLPMF